MGKMLWMWIGIGGFIGSLLRYGMSGVVQQWSKRDDFPFGTLAVNVIGCLLIGLISQAVESRGAFSPEFRAFLLVGVLGGFTTFSAFGNETMNLWRDGQSLLSSANVASQLVFGLGAVWLGRVLGMLLWR